ncbi:MAG: glycosyltransferase [Thermodesulfobacteriota bacterium]
MAVLRGARTGGGGLYPILKSIIIPYIPIFEWLPDWLVKRDGGLWERLDLLNLKLEMFVFDNVMNVFKRLSKKHGLRKTITATNCLTGNDVTFLADIQEYFPTRDLPEDYHYIGPLTLKSSIPPPSWWPPGKGNKPLIYITMGTTGIGHFFQTVYDLLKVSDMMAIVTTGDQVTGMESIEGKIYFESFMDGDLVMEVCDVVVCRGGNGTIYQALQHGKPVIRIPTIPDQAYNMRRVEALGVGKSITWKEFDSNPKSAFECY